MTSPSTSTRRRGAQTQRDRCSELLTLLQGDAPLAIEIQGHTDNVGGDDYDLKLPQERADVGQLEHCEHANPAS